MVLEPLTRSAFVVAISCLLSSSSSSSARAQEGRGEEAGGGRSHAFSGTRLTLDPETSRERVLELGCSGTHAAVAGDALFVACDGGVLLVYDLRGPSGPELESRRTLDGEVQGFFVRGGRVWVEVARLEAHPVGTTTIARTARDAARPEVSAPPGLARASAPAPLIVGNVIEILEGGLHVDLGEAQGVRVNDRIELFERSIGTLGAGESTTRDETIAVGVVTAVSKNRAEVRLGINERVPMGAQARVTDAPVSKSGIAPPRADGLFETKFMFRPFLTLDTLGIGLVSEMSIGYRFASPLFLQLAVEPFALGLAKERRFAPIALNLFLAYDLKIFEVGLGLGWLTLHEPPTVFNPTKSIGNMPSALSLAQTVRLGALDGLHIYVHNAFALYEEEFTYAATNATLQIPLLSETWLIARGGGGLVGYGFGEAGLRFLLRGNGDRGSLFTTASVGGAAVFTRTPCTLETTISNPEGVQIPSEAHHDCRSASYGGPMAGFGLEWRH